MRKLSGRQREPSPRYEPRGDKRPLPPRDSRDVGHPNALVSGLAGLEVPESTLRAIVWHWLNDTFELVISAGILAELERTLTKPYYRSRRSPAQIE